MRTKKHSIALVADKVLSKLGDWVDSQVAESISPQSMKQVTATLKDIQELKNTQADSGDTTIRVVFAENGDFTD